jgi:hypothetical protein
MVGYDWSSDPEPDDEPQAQAMHVPNDVLPNVEGPDELDEVERRLEKAHFYRMLLKHQLISSDSNEAIEVENEIQDFVRERLSVLLGIKPEPIHANIEVQAMFNPDEVEALRAVAAKVLNRPTIVQAQAAAPKPAPTIKPLENKPAPAPVRPAQPVAEAPRPVAPPPEPVKRGRGRPRKNPEAPRATATPIAKSEAPQKTDLNPGERIETVGAKRYKVVSRVVNDPKTGTPKLDAKGNPIMAEHRIDITPKTEIPGRQPFPSLEVQNAMEAAKAAEVLSHNPIAAGLIPTAMTMASTTEE